MVPTRYASACSEPRSASPSCGLAGVVLVMSIMLGSSLACVHAGNREPPVSTLEIATTTTDADVWVDGEYIGQVAAVSGNLRLSPGIHRVEIRKPGHFPVQRTVEVAKQAGGSVRVEAELLTDPR